MIYDLLKYVTDKGQPKTSDNMGKTSFYCRFMAAAVIAAGLVSCTLGKEYYTIDGTLTGSVPGSTVILSDGVDSVIDSSSVIDGKFRFKGEADKGKTYALIVKEPGKEVDLSTGEGILTFVAEPVEMTVSLGESSFVQGSPLTDQLNTLRQKLMEAFMQYELTAMTASEEGDYAKRDSLVEERYKVMDGLCLDAFGKNPDNAVGIQAMTFLVADLPLDEVEKLMEKAGDCVRNDPMISGQLTARRSAELSSDFMEVEGTDKDGKSVALSSFFGKGNYVLVDFWASWCGPCKEEFPFIQEVYEKWGGKGLTVVGVAVADRKDHSLKAIKKFDLGYRQILEPKGDPAAAYGITGIPLVILFSPDGEILRRGLRGEEIPKAVASVLGEN